MQRIGPGMRLAFAGEDLRDGDAIGRMGGLAGGEQGADGVGQVRRHHLVRIEVEEPIVTALGLGETLLWAIARPVVVDHACAKRCRQRLRSIGGAGIDHDEVVGEVAHGSDGRADPVGFVEGDEEDRERRRGTWGGLYGIGPAGRYCFLDSVVMDRGSSL